MWIGLLTAGAHPGRPPSTEGLATLFTWGPRERARIDGPEGALAGGVRMLARPAQAAPATGDPRCFACRAPYLVPEPAEVRAREDIVELGRRADEQQDPGGARDVDDGPPLASETDAAGRPKAVFALLHVELGARHAVVGQALLYIPGGSVVTLLPLDCLSPYAALIRQLGYPRHACERCGAIAPAGGLGEPRDAGRGPNRATRRRTGRRAA
ncbi:MAG: hypothetical protein JWM31_2062 [Solirubrobacterales bacterium]|nr:hypothetical protein [Solirubrobacterales bacterium]